LLPFDKSVARVDISLSGKIGLPGSYKVKPGEQPLTLSYDGPFEATLPDIGVYQSSTPFPAKPYGDWSVGCKLGYKFVTLNLYPVQYLPAQGRLSYYPRMTAKVYTAAVTKANLAAGYLPPRHGLSSPWLKKGLQRLVDNPQQLSGYPKLTRRVGNIMQRIAKKPALLGKYSLTRREKHLAKRIIKNPQLLSALSCDPGGTECAPEDNSTPLWKG